MNPRTANIDKNDCEIAERPSVVANLNELIEAEYQFKTILADPPWCYSNTSSRGAGENLYPTMTVEQICREPVRELVPDAAYLHLWTTNAFLEAAFTVIQAWGFEYKSCLVWAKPKIGMGNYYRVPQELLFGMRGRLRFARNGVRSWLVAPRTRHSRKPFCFRKLIEQVSPGPYLDCF